jgi:hypothetical protein
MIARASGSLLLVLLCACGGDDDGGDEADFIERAAPSGRSTEAIGRDDQPNVVAPGGDR